MQIKSWQIAFVGIVIQLFVDIFIKSNSVLNIIKTSGFSNFLTTEYIFLLLLLIWAVVVKTLYLNEDKKNKAVLSFFVGISSIICGEYIAGNFFVFASLFIFFTQGKLCLFIKEKYEAGLKSWQVALAGLIIHSATVFLIFILGWPSLISKIVYGDFGVYRGPDPKGALLFPIFYVIFIVAGIIPTLLLYFNKTKAIGAASSILLGLFGISFFIGGTFRAIPIFLIAGIYYFWKKV